MQALHLRTRRGACVFVCVIWLLGVGAAGSWWWAAPPAPSASRSRAPWPTWASPSRTSWWTRRGAAALLLLPPAALLFWGLLSPCTCALGLPLLPRRRGGMAARCCHLLLYARSARLSLPYTCFQHIAAAAFSVAAQCWAARRPVCSTPPGLTAPGPRRCCCRRCPRGPRCTRSSRRPLARRPCRECRARLPWAASGLPWAAESARQRQASLSLFRARRINFHLKETLSLAPPQLRVRQRQAAGRLRCHQGADRVRQVPRPLAGDCQQLAMFAAGMYASWLAGWLAGWQASPPSPTTPSLSLQASLTSCWAARRALPAAARALPWTTPLCRWGLGWSTGASGWRLHLGPLALRAALPCRPGLPTCLAFSPAARLPCHARSWLSMLHPPCPPPPPPPTPPPPPSLPAGRGGPAGRVCGGQL